MKLVFLISFVLFGTIASAPNNGHLATSKRLSLKNIIGNVKDVSSVNGVPLWEVDLNPWWDSFFVSYKKYMETSGGDSISLPEIEYAFEQKVGLITIKGSMGWYEGVLSGMETLHRNMDTKLMLSTLTDNPTEGDDLQLRFTGGLGVEFLNGFYHGKVTFMDTKADADVSLNIDEFKIEFNAKFQTDCTFELEELEIIPGQIKVTVTDVPYPLNTIIEYVANIGLEVFKKGFVKAIEVFIRDFLAKHLLKDLASSLCETEPPCPKNITLYAPKFNRL